MNRILLEETEFPYKMIEVDILDDILKNKSIDKVDFIKIDVEGFENSVLLGAKKTLQTKPILFIEIDDNYLKENKSGAKEIVELLLDLGYKSLTNAENGEEITVSSAFNNCHFDLIAR
jgi:Methyltransferase FkbM domain